MVFLNKSGAKASAAVPNWSLKKKSGLLHGFLCGHIALVNVSIEMRWESRIAHLETSCIHLEPILVVIWTGHDLAESTKSV